MTHTSELTPEETQVFGDLLRHYLNECITPTQRVMALQGKLFGLIAGVGGRRVLCLMTVCPECRTPLPSYNFGHLVAGRNGHEEMSLFYDAIQFGEMPRFQQEACPVCGHPLHGPA